MSFSGPSSGPYSNQDNTSNPLPPSQAEREGYFRGIGGLLLARTGPPWAAPLDILGYPKVKHIYEIGKGYWTEQWHKSHREFPEHSTLANAVFSAIWETGVRGKLVIDVVRIGYEQETATSVILIQWNTEPGAEPPWLTCKEAVVAVKEMLLCTNFPSSIRVELKSAIIGDQISGSAASPAAPWPYHKPPWMGDSLGQSETNFAGTLGAFLSIVGGPYSGARVAITNDHVADFGGTASVTFRPVGADGQVSAPITIVARQSWTSRLARIQHVNRDMRSPANNDHEHALQNQQKQLNKYTSRMKVLDDLRENQDGFLIPRQEEEIQRLQQLISDTRVAINDIQHADRYIGEAIAGSGQSISVSHPGYHLDWALIRLPPNMQSSKIFFHRMTPKDIQLEAIDRSFPEHSEDTTILEVAGTKDGVEFDPQSIFTIDQITEAMRRGDEYDLHVVKRGRSTGWTAGKINRVDSLMNLDCKTKGLTFRTMSVTNIGPNRHFIDGGDNGAIVLDLHGRTVGLVHAGIVGQAGCSLAYVIPWEVIEHDILDKLSAKRITFDVPPPPTNTLGDITNSVANNR